MALDLVSKTRTSAFGRGSIRIEDLQAELENLTLELRIQQQNVKVGDTVQIINNYRGQHGTIGTVLKVTRKQVVLVDSQGHTYRQAKRNIQVLSNLAQ